MGKIKVLRVIARMNVGGPAFLIKELMTGIDQEQFDQILVYGVCEGDEVEIEGVKNLSRTIKIKDLRRSLGIQADLKALQAIKNVIRSEKPDIIDTHTFKAGFLVRFIYLFSFKRNTKIVHHYHGHLLSGYFRPRTLTIYKIIERILAVKANVLVTDGLSITNELVTNGIAPLGKFRHLTPGVAVPSGVMVLSKFSDAESLNRKIVIAFIGRLVPIKRPDRFLDLVKELSEKRKDCEFYMYGEGELRNFIEERISHEDLPVKLMPFEKSIFQILKNVDLLVMTSDNEGTPLTVMEASYAGVPCFGTNVGSMGDIVENGVNGYLVNPDISSLVMGLNKLLDDRLTLAQLQLTASEYAEKNFNVRRYVEAHEELYKGLVSSGN